MLIMTPLNIFGFLRLIPFEVCFPVAALPLYFSPNCMWCPEINLRCYPPDPSLSLEILFLGAGAHSSSQAAWPVNLSDLLVSPSKQWDCKCTVVCQTFFYLGTADWIKVLRLYCKHFTILQAELSLRYTKCLSFDSTNNWASRSKNFNILYLGLVI